MEHVSCDDVHMSGRSSTENCNVIDYVLTKTSFVTRLPSGSAPQPIICPTVLLEIRS